MKRGRSPCLISNPDGILRGFFNPHCTAHQLCARACLCLVLNFYPRAKFHTWTCFVFLVKLNSFLAPERSLLNIFFSLLLFQKKSYFFFFHVSCIHFQSFLFVCLLALKVFFFIYNVFCFQKNMLKLQTHGLKVLGFNTTFLDVREAINIFVFWSLDSLKQTISLILQKCHNFLFNY